MDSEKANLAFILNPLSEALAATSRTSSPTLSPSRKEHNSDDKSQSSDYDMDDGNATNASEDLDDDDTEGDENCAPLLHIQGRSLLSAETILEKRVHQLLSIGNHNGKMRVRKSSICAHIDCPRAAVSRGRCVRHGGGSRCTFPNCTHGARLYNRCFHHGGCKLCKIDGCTSKAKRYGYCWSHGGGHICDSPGCNKVAAPGGFCWAHGGGNRCKMEGCNRRSYQKHNYFCKQHMEANSS